MLNVKDINADMLLRDWITLINENNQFIRDELERIRTSGLDGVLDENLQLKIDQTMPIPKMQGTFLSYSLKDGTQVIAPVNLKGDTGAKGDPFTIYKTYPTIDSMNLDKNAVPDGSFVAIASTVEDPDNAKLFLKGEEQFTFITDLSGATGLKGDTGLQGPKGESIIDAKINDNGHFIITIE